ncbi:RtcB family protein, partial [Patescibacteria group bacterium]|nr:RtcB family protein [Patescibacteria group bacterium]
MDIKDFKKISDVLWELPKTFRKDMRAAARVYATDEMLKDMMKDRSLQQLVNTATLPGIVGSAMVMPDAHEGYGFPIGGVVATKFPDGIISPGGVGYDINCGVRLIKTEMHFDDLRPEAESLGRQLFHAVPSGVGRGGTLKLGIGEMDKVLKLGAKWMVREGYGTGDDLEHIESGGCLSNADCDVVSDHAKKRGADQLGTMGAGNHFVEVDRVESVFDEETARAFGIFEGQIVVLIHMGSRGLGHQIATDHIRTVLKAMPKYGITLPDNELACVPLSSNEGTDYYNAMAAGANFAWANRQMITHEVRRAWETVFGTGAGRLDILYDVAHNMAKIENHSVGGIVQKLIVHRKGATRSFGPGHPDIPSEFREVGQPVLIPGSMGTASYILAGTEKSMLESFGSCCHGAGRKMS